MPIPMVDKKASLPAAPAPTFVWAPELTDDKTFAGYKKLQGKVFYHAKGAPFQFPPAFIQPSKSLRRISYAKEPIYVTQIDTIQGCLRLTGVTQHAETISLKVKDFHPVFYVDKPDNINTTQDLEKLRQVWNSLDLPPSKWGGQRKEKREKKEWKGKGPNGKSKKHQADDSDSDDDEEKNANITKLTIEMREPCPGFSYDQKKPYIRIALASYNMFCAYRDLFLARAVPESYHPGSAKRKFKVYRGDWKLEEQFFESNIRLNDCTMVDFKQCTLLNRTKASFYRDRETTMHIEGTAPYKALTPMNVRVIPPLLHMTFDLEQISERDMEESIRPEEDRSTITYFPDPTKKGDEVISIATDLAFQGKNEPFLSMVHSVKKSTNKLPNVLSYQFETERDMLRHWIQTIRNVFDVETFEGFNSLGFDLPVIFKRCRVLGIQKEFQKLARFVRYKDRVDLKMYESDTQQMGDKKVEYVNLPGCVQFDVFIAARKNEKVNQYNLKSLVELLKDGTAKKDLDYALLSPYYAAAGERGEQLRGEINEYCWYDVVATRKLCNGRKYYSLYQKIGQITNTGMNDLMLRGTTQQSLHMIQIKLHNDGWMLDDELRAYYQSLYGAGSCPRCPMAKEKKKVEWKGSKEQPSRSNWKGGGWEPTNNNKLVSHARPEQDEEDNQANEDEGEEIEDDQSSARKRKKPVNTWGSLKGDRSLTKKEKKDKDQKSGKRKKFSKPKAKPIDTSQLRLSNTLGVRTFNHQTDVKSKTLYPEQVDYCEHDCPIYPPGTSTSYDGGTVLDAKAGYYTVPVATLDFASLYPSLIMAYFLCFCNFIPCKPGTSDPDIKNPDPRKELVLQKAGVGLQTCYYVQSYGGKKVRTIIPEIERELVAERKIIKNEQAKADEDHNKPLEAMLDCHQKAVKVCANGLYGAFANRFMKVAFKPIAMSTTFLGRENILLSKTIAEMVFGCEVIYGDSVSGDTPILCKSASGRMCYRNIEDIAATEWVSYGPEKEEAMTKPETYVWSDSGWTLIKKVIRHKTNKKMFRILTHTGVVNVTEDHSLLSPAKAKLATKNVTVGTSLLHHSLPMPHKSKKKLLSAWRRGNGRTYSTQLETARMYWIGVSLGYSLAILHKNNEYRIVEQAKADTDDKIQQMELLPSTTDYVYDLETESHHFAAGPGQLVVHNTDSLFIIFPEPPYKRVPGNEAETQRNRYKALGAFVKMVADCITMCMVEPMKLEFEKIMNPLKLMGKKNYCGWIRYWVDDVKHHKFIAGQVEKMIERGLASVRRDYMPLIRNLCKKTLEYLFADHNANRGLKLLQEVCDRFVAGKVEADELVRTVQAKGAYSNNKLIQARLFQRMRERGQDPSPGTRVPFLFRQPDVDHEGMHERELVYDVDDFKKQKLVPYFHYYLAKQIRNPMLKVLRGIVPEDVINRMINKALAQLKRQQRTTSTLGSFYKSSNETEVRAQADAQAEVQGRRKRKLMDRTPTGGIKIKKITKPDDENDTGTRKRKLE